jgi:hypothetical protein
MCFQKPYKTGSCLHDLLAYENGNTQCLCGALNIDDNKTDVGRYPAQTFCNYKAADSLDEQSGLTKSSGGSGEASMKTAPTEGIYGKYKEGYVADNLGGLGDVAGCSKALHKCDYENEELNLYYYCPKVSQAEKNNGCENGNSHPTLKPIKLNERILRLFKTPNPQVILYPFAGSGSEVIGGEKAGFDTWLACEINEEYTTIAEARLKYYRENI